MYTQDVNIDSLSRDSVDGAYHCPTCMIPFTRRSNLRRHYAIHTRNRDHRCPSCDKAFSRSDALKHHLSQCSKNGSNSFSKFHSSPMADDGCNNVSYTENLGAYQEPRVVDYGDLNCPNYDAQQSVALTSPTNQFYGDTSYAGSYSCTTPLSVQPSHIFLDQSYPTPNLNVIGTNATPYSTTQAKYSNMTSSQQHYLRSPNFTSQVGLPYMSNGRKDNLASKYNSQEFIDSSSQLSHALGPSHHSNGPGFLSYQV